jgi:Zinc finger, C3HC4 type (RING finger)/Deltex C-terminal domain
MQFEAPFQSGAPHHQHIRCVRFVNIDQSTSDAFVDAFKIRNSMKMTAHFGTSAVMMPLLDVASGPNSLPADPVSRADRKLKRKVRGPADVDPPDDGAKKPKDDDGSGDEEDCVICMDKITDPKKLACGHVFCTPCIDQYFGVSQPKCPSCGRLFGVMKGNQPPGFMNVRTLSQSLTGYETYDTIEITYNIPDGIQTVSHLLVHSIRSFYDSHIISWRSLISVEVPLNVPVYQ